MLDELTPKAHILLIYCKWQDGAEGWVLPKGTIEPGELLENTVLREVAEETGYHNFRVLEPLGKSDFEFFDTNGNLCHKTIDWFVGVLNSKDVLPQKLEEDEKETIKAVEWFPIAEAESLILFDTERILFPKLVEFIGTITQN